VQNRSLMIDAAQPCPDITLNLRAAPFDVMKTNQLGLGSPTLLQISSQVHPPKNKARVLARMTRARIG
jgi:hypothetical protein